MEIWDTTYNRLNRRQRTMATYGNALIVIIKKNKKRERGGGLVIYGYGDVSQTKEFEDCES